MGWLTFYLTVWLSPWLIGVLLSGILGGILWTVWHDRRVASLSFARRLSLQNGRITARLEAVPLRELMAEIERLSGVRIRWVGPVEETLIFVDFTDIPLPVALRRILSEKNLLLSYAVRGKDIKLVSVWVSSRARTVQSVFPRPPVPTPRKPPTPMTNFTPFTPRTLMLTALYGQDPVARVRAVRRLRRHAATDTRVKALLSRLARSPATPRRVRSTAANMLERIR
jgi:hypothetical protein